MAKPGRSDEVSIDTSKASQPEVPKAPPPAAAPQAQASAVITVPVAAAQPLEVPLPVSMITAFEREADAAHRRGDYLTEGYLRDVAVAAGHLRQKVAAAVGVVAGPAAAYIEELYSVL
jgi:hypothetical protein